ncbi:T9SS type A sorting domain-containing protein [Flavobacterium algicola]|uniref:T9SS type A sorting domain-containing protein n=1 Tax=Flavobacterium algicola TaxID=556529 RepID=UPI001EFC50B4|nr:T9SS type A sorting domain-containing protein [Flavobacterium algicola]MCG9791785.1 T9SS type A sorting domain-containing protein [Flavobacterium algicola]
MKTKLLLIAALTLTAASSFCQTTLFFDNFDPASFPSPDATLNKPFAASSPSSSVSSGLYTYTGYNSSASGWNLSSGNGTSGLNCIYTSASATYATNLSVQGSSAADSKAATTIAVPMSSFISGFNPILKNNSNVLTWSYNMRINRGAQLTQLATALTPASGICGGLILATDAVANAPISDAGNGYAVIFSGQDGGTTNSVALGVFTGGINNGTFSTILKVNGITIGSNAISVVVTYAPTNDTWTLKVRQDLSTSYVDPESTTANNFVVSSPASAVEASYTTATNTNMMMYFNYNGTNGMYLDNLKVKTAANLAVAQNDIKGLSVYPNPVTSGKIFINSDSGEVKKVTIYSILGVQVLSKDVTSGLLDVSTIKKGTYVMKITEAGKTSTRKIVID